MIADLVDLGWLPAPDRGDKHAHPCAGRPCRAGDSDACSPHRRDRRTSASRRCGQPRRRIAIGFDESARLSPRPGTPAERGGPRGSALGVSNPARFSVQRRRRRNHRGQPPGGSALRRGRYRAAAAHLIIADMAAELSPLAPPGLSLGTTRRSRLRSTGAVVGSAAVFDSAPEDVVAEVGARPDQDGLDYLL
jgi:hypothetical protein